MEGNNMVQPEVVPAEQTPSLVEESKPSDEKEPSKTQEDVEDPPKDHAETVSEGEETSLGEENKQGEGVGDSTEDQANSGTAQMEQTNVNGLTQSPPEENEPSDTKSSKTPKPVEGPGKDNAETVSEGEETSLGEKNKQGEGVGDSTEDQLNTGTAKMELTNVDGPTHPPKDNAETVSEGEETSLGEKNKQGEGVGDSTEDQANSGTAQMEQTNVNGLTQSPPEENEPSDTKSSKKPEHVEDPGKVRDLFFFAIFGIPVVAILLWFIWSRNASEVDIPNKPAERCDPRKGDCSQFLSQSIHKLSEKYKDQDNNSWRTLHAAALSHVSLKPKPVRPIVILVYWVNASNSQILFDISKVYSSVLSGSKDDANITILGKDFVNREPESVQKLIAERLEHGFKDGKKVAIIHDFDNLPSCSVLTFHNYCNNEDAPYTNVAIILTMTGNPEMEPGQKPKVLEESVSTIFHKKWSDCPDDLPPGKIDAILSRVANNVVLLR